MPQDQPYSKDYAQDIAELMDAGRKGDPRSQGAIEELYALGQKDPRVLNILKDAAGRLNENRHVPMKPEEGPIWPRLAELRGEAKAEPSEPTDREAKLLDIIKSLMGSNEETPNEIPA